MNPLRQAQCPRRYEFAIAKLTYSEEGLDVLAVPTLVAVTATSLERAVFLAERSVSALPDVDDYYYMQALEDKKPISEDVVNAALILVRGELVNDSQGSSPRT